MPEVDKSVSSPAQPTTNGQPTGGASPATTERTSKPAQPGRDARIDELVAQRERFRMQFEQEKASREELANEVKQLKELVTQGRESRPDDQPITSWQQFSNKDLDGVIAEGPTENPVAFQNAINEKIRRSQEAAIKGASQLSRQEMERNRYQEEVFSDIRRDFPQAFDVNGKLDRTSPLYQKADQEYGRLIQVYGKTTVDAMPDIQRLCLAKAHRELTLPDMEELQSRRREAEERKRQEALQTGFGSPRDDQAFQDALRKKDRKAIFQNLGIVKSLNQRRG